MITEDTPAEKLQKANEEYHEASDELMLSGEYDVELKAAVGNILSEIFAQMKQINELLNPQEEPEEP